MSMECQMDMVDGEYCCQEESCKEEVTMDSCSTTCEEAWPLAHVQFFHNFQSWCVRQRLEEYITELISLQSVGTAAAETQIHGIGEERPRGEDAGSVIYYTSFCEDRAGLPPSASGGPEGIPHHAQVTYGQVYLEPFWINPLVEQEERRLRRMAIKCFNCGEDHHIKDCTLPKDMARICEERQSFRANLGTLGADTRYHLSPSSQQHSKFCPGQISAKLRSALNLSPTDYPPYIRRMLIHGYPPGYRLLEQENHLSLIDDSTAVDGDANLNTARRPLEIIYPGFNDKSHTDSLGLKIKPVTMATNKATSLDEELGDIAGYEFEEHETEGGEHVVGLKVKEKEVEEEAPGNHRCKCFSVDFPPGLVHLDTESQSTPENSHHFSVRLVEPGGLGGELALLLWPAKTSVELTRSECGIHSIMCSMD